MDSIHHSERPRQAPVVGPGEPHEIHKKNKGKVLHLGHSVPHYPSKLVDKKIEHSPAEND